MNNLNIAKRDKDFVEIIVDQIAELEEQGIVFNENSIKSLITKLYKLQEHLSTQEEGLLCKVIQTQN